MSTTQGFDIAGEIHESVPNIIASAYWSAGILPDHIRAETDLLPVVPADRLPEIQALLGLFPGLEFFFAAPTIKVIDGAPGLIGAVRFHQKFIVRTDAIPGEISNQLIFSVPFDLRTRMRNGVEVQLIEADLAVVEAGDISFAQPLHNAFLEAMLREGVILTFRNRLISIPIAPDFLGGEIKLSPQIVEGSPTPLRVFVNLDGRSGGFVSPAATMLPFDMFDVGPKIGLAVAIKSDMLLGKLNKELHDRGIVSGGTLVDNVNQKLIDWKISGTVALKPNVSISFFDDVEFTLPIEIDIFSATLERIDLTSDLQISLVAAGIRIKGSMEMIVDNAPDPDVDFDVVVGIGFSEGKATAEVISADIDVDTTALTVLSAILFGPIGLIAMNIVDWAVDEAAGKSLLGETQSAAVPNRTIFVGDAAISNAETDSPITFLVVPDMASTRPDAIVVKLIFKAVVQEAAHTLPMYFIGNLRSMQIHQPSCRFAEQIKRASSFVRIQEAIDKGYDGCKFCLPQFDGAAKKPK